MPNTSRLVLFSKFIVTSGLLLYGIYFYVHETPGSVCLLARLSYGELSVKFITTVVYFLVSLSVNSGIRMCFDGEMRGEDRINK